MTADIKRQLVAHGASTTPKRTSGRAAAERSTTPRKTPQEIEAEELANPQIQAARLCVVGPARLAYTNTTFGVPLFCRKYQVTDEAQAAQLDTLFHRITGTEPA